MKLLKILRWLLLIAFAIAVFLGPWLANFIGNIENEGRSSLPFDGPSKQYLLGTDYLGHSVLTELLRGGQVLLLMAIIAGTITTVIAVVVGAFAAMFKRLEIVVDLLTDAIILVPSLIILLVLTLLFPNAGYGMLIVAVAILGVPYASRVVLASSLRVVNAGYVQVAIAAGESRAKVVFRDVVPNILNIVMMLWGLRIVEALYVLAIASFLGVGKNIGESAWSAMVRDNAHGILLNHWAVTAPSLLLAISSIALMSVLRVREIEVKNS